MAHAPVVAVIHATTASLEPVKSAFAQTCPEVELWHLMDDRLVREAGLAGGLTPELHGRMATLIQYALDTGADAVQLACSMYGPVAVALDGDVPVVAADQAMFDRVAVLAPARVAVLATADASAQDTVERLRRHLAAAGLETEIRSSVVANAAPALADAAIGLASTVDVVVLAQYSMSPTLEAVTEALASSGIAVPVLSPAHLAADKVARLVQGETGEEPG